MNNSDNRPPEADIDLTELVAYLDNELDDGERQRVERRLGEDPQYQELLQTLQRSWDCLDALPSVSTNERFTESTLEMVAQQARQELEQSQRSHRRWQRHVTAGALSAVVLLATFGIVFSAYRSAADHHLQELPMVDNLDLYRQVDSVEFLERLKEADDTSPSSTTSPLSGPVPVGEISSDDLPTLRSYVEELTPVEKVQLREKRERFEQYSIDERQRIRQLHADLTSRPDRLEMHRALVQYTDWLASLTARQQLDVKEMSIDDRINEIRKMQQEQEQKALEEFAITSEDAAAIETWLGDLARSNLEKIRAQLPGDMQQRLDSIKDPKQSRWMVIGTLYFSRSRGIRTEVAPTADQMQRLFEQLTVSVRESLEQLEGSEEQFEVILHWVRGFHRARWRQVKKEDLEALFHELPTDQRESLEAMSPQRMQAELTKLYHRTQFRKQMGNTGGGMSGRLFPGSDDGRRRGGGRRGRNEDGPPRDGPPPFDPDRQRPDEGHGPGRPPGRPEGPLPTDEERPPAAGAPQSVVPAPS